MNISIKSRSQIKPGVLKCDLSSFNHNGGNDAENDENDDGAQNTDGDDGVGIGVILPTPGFVQL